MGNQDCIELLLKCFLTANVYDQMTESDTSLHLSH